MKGCERRGGLSQAVAVALAVALLPLAGCGGGDGASEEFAPRITSSDTLSVMEGASGVVHEVMAEVPGGLTLSFAVAGGADASRFTMDAASGDLSFVAAPNFDAPADADTDNVYEVVVEAVAENGLRDRQAVRVSVENAPEGFISASKTPFTEGSANRFYEAKTLESAGEDGAGEVEVFFRIAGGEDSSLFQINEATGWLAFRTAPAFDNPFDADGDNIYRVMLQAVSTAGEDYVLEVAVQVFSADGNSVPSFDRTAFTVEDSDADGVVATVSVTDADEGDVHTFTISGGVDADQLRIADGGDLSFAQTPSAGNPQDADADNEYEIVVNVNDGNGGVAEADMTVTVSAGQ